MSQIELFDNLLYSKLFNCEQTNDKYSIELFVLDY